MKVHTDLNFLKPGQKWPPEADKPRLDRYAKNRLLLEGDHNLVFADLNDDDAPRKINMRVNWHRRIATLFADLASPARIAAEEEATMERIAEANSLDILLYDLFTDLISLGDGILKARWNGARGVLSRIDPGSWFPVVSPDDVTEFTAHVLAWEIDEGEDKYIKCEIHRPGKIEHKLFKLTTDGKEIKEPVPLATFERYATLPDEEETGVAGFLVFPFSNLKAGDGVFGLDDFKSISDLVEELERRLIKVSGTLDIFADPWMCGPPGLRVRDPLTGEIIWDSDEKYIALNEGETPPKVLTWDAEMTATFTQIETLLSQLYVMAELSPAAFGEVKSGLAESGSALKRLMLPTLAKVARLRLRAKPRLLEALATLAELEVASRMPGAEALTNVSLEWRSALPQDLTEAAAVELTRRRAKATSIRGSLARLDPDASEADLDREEGAIKEEEREEAQNLL